LQNLRTYIFARFCFLRPESNQSADSAARKSGTAQKPANHSEFAQNQARPLGVIAEMQHRRQSTGDYFGIRYFEARTFPIFAPFEKSSIKQHIGRALSHMPKDTTS
jgi:hypothetical protein